MSIYKTFFIILLGLVGTVLEAENIRYEDSVFSVRSSKTRDMGGGTYQRQKNNAVAFYIGEGRFVTNLHTLLHLPSFSDNHKIVIQTKRGDIVIEKILHIDSSFDLVVLKAKKKSVEGLRPLSLGVARGDTVVTINFEKLETVPLLFSKEQRFLYHNYSIDVSDERIEQGMSGGPLVFEDQVQGILSSQRYFKGYGPPVNTFTSTYILLRLLETEELDCSFSDCIERSLISLRRRAMKGHTASQIHLGSYLLEGIGMKQNLPQALELFKKLGSKNYPYQQSRVGFMYFYGYGTPVNTTKAFEWFQRAAALKDPYAKGMIKKFLRPTEETAVVQEDSRSIQ